MPYVLLFKSRGFSCPYCLRKGSGQYRLSLADWSLWLTSFHTALTQSFFCVAPLSVVIQLLLESLMVTVLV
jgi:hypothetical protein